jgi:hypothetical protein
MIMVVIGRGRRGFSEGRNGQDAWWAGRRMGGQGGLLETSLGLLREEDSKGGRGAAVPISRRMVVTLSSTGGMVCFAAEGLSVASGRNWVSRD